MAGTVAAGYIKLPPQPKSDWKLTDFELLAKLGTGQYGTVFLATIKSCNYLVALKQLNLERLAGFEVLGQLRREVEIAFHCRHKYVLRTYGYFYDKDNCYLIMEPCSRGMLYSELNRVKKFAPATAAKYVAQLAESLLYLHQHHVLHRDIKPENIMLDHNLNIKLADFGWSVHDPKSRRKTMCGTPEYLCPEIVTNQPYDTSADLWCIGIFCYECLVGSTPFYGATQQEITKKIREMKFVIPPTVPEEAKDLIESLLRREGSSRISLYRIVNHPFLLKYYYMPNNITPPNAKRNRGDAPAAKQLLAPLPTSPNAPKREDENDEMAPPVAPALRAVGAN